MRGPADPAQVLGFTRRQGTTRRDKTRQEIDSVPVDTDREGLKDAAHELPGARSIDVVDAAPRHGCEPQCLDNRVLLFVGQDAAVRDAKEASAVALDVGALLRREG